jgi:hypothetical protein
MNSTHETAIPASSRLRRRPRRPRLPTGAVAALAVAGLAAVAGCQSTAAAGSSAAATPTQAAATSAAPATSPAAATSTPVQATRAPISVPPSGPAAAPVLGQLTGIFAHGTGFGQVRPAEIFNGGDPTGLVSKITWQSWGGGTATGTGTSTYVAGNQPVAAGTQQSATVVAFHLGTCGGKLMYQAVEWYFPQHGQAFSSTHYENVCTGTYVPAP